MNHSISHIILLSLSVLFCGCNGLSLQQNRTPITFDGGWNDNASRGLGLLVDSTLNTMGVFVGYENEDESFGSSSSANNYADNVRYTRHLGEPFASDSVSYWPFKGKLSFFAYAPFISKQYLQFSSAYVSGYPIMRYSPTVEVSNQPDFCLAEPVLDQHMSLNPIKLNFYHSLSLILFSANYQGQLPETSANLYVKIDNINLCNVIGTKIVTMSSGSPCFVWQDDSECPDSTRVTYRLNRRPDMHIVDDSLRNAIFGPDNFINVSYSYGRMFLLPQSMSNDEVYLEVTFGYYEKVNEVEVQRAGVTTTCPLPAVTWEPCKTYRYRFTINLTTSNIVNPAVSVEPWQNVDNTSINPTHIE